MVSEPRALRLSTNHITELEHPVSRKIPGNFPSFIWICGNESVIGGFFSKRRFNIIFIISRLKKIYRDFQNYETLIKKKEERTILIDVS